MSKYLTVLFFLVTLNLAFGNSSRRATRVKKDTSILTPTLGLNESIYQFRFSNLYGIEESQQIIEYSIDGVPDYQTIGSNDNLKLTTTPGKHIFQIVYNHDYKEVFTDTLEIEAQYTDIYFVELQSAEIETIYFKPVIYLYPQVETTVDVVVDIKGHNPFFYPEYKDGWTCTASPNGDITISDDVYNYLFWEADGIDQLDRNEANKGFYVAGKDAIKFLEEKLTLAGLTSKEQADFITFWGPLTQKNDLNFVRFEFNETCDKFTKLNITPKPDNIYRIYIFFSPINAAFDVEEQEIKGIDRTGFTVLEWGGQVSEQIKNIPNTI